MYFGKKVYPHVRLSGIYKITHKPTGMCYIGKSVDIFSRWSKHYTDIKQNKHSSPMLTFQWLYSKPIEWEFTLLEIVDFDEYKRKSHLPADFITKSFDNHLLDLEKKYMKEHSKNFAMNTDNKHFS